MKHLKIKELFASDLVAMNIPDLVLLPDRSEKHIFCSGSQKRAPFPHKQGLSLATVSPCHAPANINKAPQMSDIVQGSVRRLSLVTLGRVSML